MDSLPEDLLGLVASLLVPRLALPDLQALHLTCYSSRRLIQAATPHHWQAAAEAHGFQPSSYTAASSYHATAKLAALHAAVSTGPSSIHTVHGRLESANPGQGTVEELALHPSFTHGVRTHLMEPSRPSVVPLQYGASTPGEAARLQDSAHKPLTQMPLLAEHCGAPDGSCVLLHMRCCCSDRAADDRGCSLCLYWLSSPETRHVHLPLEQPVRQIAWAPDSCSFVVSMFSDTSEDEVFLFHALGSAEPSIWQLPVDSTIVELVAWSPCSTFLGLVVVDEGAQIREVIIVHMLLRVVVSKVSLPAIAVIMYFHSPCLQWVTVGASLALAVWGQNPFESSLLDAATPTTVHFIVPGASEGVPRVIPVGNTAVDYGMAGSAGGGLLLVHLQQHDAGVGPAMPAALRVTLPSTGVVRRLLAWAPQGGIWLAVVSIELQENGTQAASLAIVDGRTGRVRSDTVVATYAGKKSLWLQTITWSSSGLALLVAMHTQRWEGWIKSYVSFRDSDEIA